MILLETQQPLLHRIEQNIEFCSSSSDFGVMGPSGTPIGNAQSVSPALLRSNSAILGSQGGLMPPQGTISSAVSPRAQYNMNLYANANISSLLNQTFGNGATNLGPSGLAGFQRGNADAMTSSDPLSNLSTDVGFTASLSPFGGSSMINSGSGMSGQVQNQQMSITYGNSMVLDQQHMQVQKLDQRNFQHAQQSMQQHLASHGEPQQQQPQFQSIRGGLSGIGHVKLEPQMTNDYIGSQQQLQSFRSSGPANLEPQQNQIGRGMGPVKLERQPSDKAMLQHQQQQQQQQQHFLQLSQQQQMNLLQQQRILQLQQQQQQLKAHPQQQPQLQQQFHQHNLPSRSIVRPVHEPGTCARRLTQYMHQQQQRPNDNNIEFWRKFVAEFFAPKARKRWCVSLYGSSRQTNGVFPQDVWHCEICKQKPVRGFETTVDVLPRLFKIKYDSGTLEELLYVDMPCEYQNANGQIVLDYAKAIQESVFEHLRVVRDGQLRIVFSPDLKICSWEFCARRHEELIPRRLIIPPVSQLGAVAQKYQASAQNTAANLSSPDLQSNCNMFVTSARQLAKALEVPLVNDLGYTKRYVRCLQISEVVNSMKDLIDQSGETGKGPMECLAQFSQRTSSDPSSGLHVAQQPEEQQQIGELNVSNDHNLLQASVVQPSTSNGAGSVTNSHGMMSTSTSNISIVGLLRQNSMNSRIESQINNPNSPYAGTPVQIPSAGSSTTLPSAQTNPSSPFSSPTPSSSNNPPQSSQKAVAAPVTTNNINSMNSSAQVPIQPSSQSNEVDPNDSESSFEKILQEIMISSQVSSGGITVNVGSVGNNVKSINGTAQLSHNSISNGNCLVGNGIFNNHSAISTGLGNLGGGPGVSTTACGIKGSHGNNLGALTGRAGMPLMPQDASMNYHQQLEMANRLRNGLGAVNAFSNLQSEWKSP
ncbi:hypothetical protein Q3G72_025138 [Acer saccharum]|nr:hypothetical protein Q3G72_025138 [Acer saccharum]